MKDAQAIALVEMGSPSLPSFRECREKNSAVMAPDVGFTKQLQALDKELEVLWNWALEKWEIWRFPKGEGNRKTEPFHILTVQTKGKEYLELSQEILLRLQWSDSRRWTTNSLIAYFDEMDNQTRRRKRKDFTNLIEDITKETLNYQFAVPMVQVPENIKVRRIIEEGKNEEGKSGGISPNTRNKGLGEQVSRIA